MPKFTVQGREIESTFPPIIGIPLVLNLFFFLLSLALSPFFLPGISKNFAEGFLIYLLVCAALYSLLIGRKLLMKSETPFKRVLGLLMVAGAICGSIFYKQVHAQVRLFYFEVSPGLIVPEGYQFAWWDILGLITFIFLPLLIVMSVISDHKKKKEILKHGIQAQAKVLKLEDFSSNAEASPPTLKFTLEVTPLGQKPYQVESNIEVPFSKLGEVKKGITLSVRVHPTDKSSMIVDWEKLDHDS